MFLAVGRSIFLLPTLGVAEGRSTERTGGARTNINNEGGRGAEIHGSGRLIYQV